MDKKIDRTQSRRWAKYAKWFAGAGVAAVMIYAFASNGSSIRRQKVDVKSISVSDVVKGEFEEFLSVRGTVVPKTTVYLDATVGGTVKERLVEQGEYVKEGQPMIRLMNADLYLDVISRETQITEQLNFLRNTQLQAETNALDVQRSILEAENEIAHLQRKIDQMAPLVERELVSRSQYQEAQQDLKYQRQKHKIALERQSRESAVRSLQIKQLEESATKLNENLQFGRANLDSLLVKAPVSGFLSELNAELGELKTSGSRLGQIDIPGAFKVLATLDEYYLGKVSVGGQVRIRHAGKDVQATITKIDSRVKNSEFTVEIDLPAGLDESEEGIKRGQSLQVDIVVGGAIANAIMIKNGPFTRDTGGNWIFVLEEDGDKAVRRQVKLGRKNEARIQVVDGLQPGERVIVSSYAAFDKAEVIGLE